MGLLTCTSLDKAIGRNCVEGFHASSNVVVDVAVEEPSPGIVAIHVCCLDTAR